MRLPRLQRCVIFFFLGGEVAWLSVRGKKFQKAVAQLQKQGILNCIPDPTAMATFSSTVHKHH